MHAELIDGGAELLAVSTESMGLLNKYLENKILGPRFQNDMLHIARPAWENGRRLNLKNNRAYGTRFWLRKSLHFPLFEIDNL